MKIFTDSVYNRKFLSTFNKSSYRLDVNNSNYEINMKYNEIHNSNHKSPKLTSLLRLDFKSCQLKLLVLDPSTLSSANQTGKGGSNRNFTLFF